MESASAPQEFAVALLELAAVFAQGVGFRQFPDDLARPVVGEHGKNVRFAAFEQVERDSDGRLRQEMDVAPLRELVEASGIVELGGGSGGDSDNKPAVVVPKSKLFSNEAEGRNP